MVNKPSRQNSCKALICGFGLWSEAYRPTIQINQDSSEVLEDSAVGATVRCLAAAGIEDFILAATPECLSNFQSVLDDGGRYGVKISYLLMNDGEELISALSIAGEFIAQSSVVIAAAGFHEFGYEFKDMLQRAIKSNPGATIMSKTSCFDLGECLSSSLIIADRRSHQFARNTLSEVGNCAGSAELLSEYQSIGAFKTLVVEN